MKDTKEHILKTAFMLFMENSYKAVTLKDIIRETGLSNGAFYHHFESKEQLFKEVINAYLLSWARRIWEHSPKDSLWDFIQNALKDTDEIYEQVDGSLEASNNLNYLIFMFEACRLFPDVQEKINWRHKLEFATWVEVIDVAKMKGEIKSELPTELIARMFIYLPDGAYMDFLLDKNLVKFQFGVKRLWEGLYNTLKV
jgi:AcrR family transcriptional regulator